MLAELGTELRLDLLEIERLEARARSTVDPGLVPDDLRPQRLREPADGLTEVSLEELDDGRGEVELLGALDDVFL